MEADQARLKMIVLMAANARRRVKNIVLPLEDDDFQPEIDRLQAENARLQTVITPLQAEAAQFQAEKGQIQATDRRAGRRGVSLLGIGMVNPSKK
jgi:uncharacterized protein YlxW (UPF0749 family)